MIDAVYEVLRYTGHKARIELHPEMPTGPLNRVADNSLAKKLLGWEPQVKFMEGLRRTTDWYFASKDRDKVREALELLLTERQPREGSPKGREKVSVGSSSVWL